MQELDFNEALFSRLHGFIASLEYVNSIEEKQNAFMRECQECGGSYTPAHPDQAGSHLFEIKLHGESASGSSDEEVMRNWLRVATAKLAMTEDDGFITVHPPMNTWDKQQAPMAAQ